MTLYFKIWAFLVAQMIKVAPQMGDLGWMPVGKILWGGTEHTQVFLAWTSSEQRILWAVTMQLRDGTQLSDYTAHIKT